MDAKESAALRQLAARPEWAVHELPASVDADMLRCLDQAGLVEVANVILQNVQTSLRDDTPHVAVRHAWVSPIAQPNAIGRWDTIRGAKPLRAAMTAQVRKRILHDDPGGPFPKRAEEVVETVELPEVPAYWVRVTETGKAELSRMNRKKELDTLATLPDDHDCRIKSAAFLDAVRPLVIDRSDSRGWVARDDDADEVRSKGQKLAMRLALGARVTAGSTSSLLFELAKALDRVANDPQPTVNWPTLRCLVELAQLPEAYATPGGFPISEAQPPEAPVGAGMSWQEAKEKAERHVKHKKGKFPGRNALARKVGCAGSTMTKAIEESTYLTARMALAGGGAKRREVSLGDIPDAVGVSPRDLRSDQEELDRLIADQKQDAAREERQRNAAKRGRGNRS